MIIFKKRIANKYLFLGGFGLLVLVFFVFKNGEKKDLIKVERGDVVQEVSATGKTKARSEAKLGFDKGGRVARVFVDVGDYVEKGKLLAELDTEIEFANIAKERASLLEVEANLADKRRGIYIAITDAYSDADNAVRNKVDQFFKQPRENPRFEVKFNDGNYTHYFNVPNNVTLEINNLRKSVESILTSWEADLAKINESNAGDFATLAIERMNTISFFLDKVAYAINSFAPADFAYENTVATYKADINSARSTLATAKDKISTISASEAKVAQTKSSIASLEANISKFRIFAPFSGIITLQDAKVGQIATAGDSLISIISANDMYIEANVSEINIAKIKKGDIAHITFDAMPEETLTGAVQFVDPGETIIDGVANYKVRIEFALREMPVWMRSGLIANIKIITNKKESVLYLPAYLLVKEGDKSFVYKMINDKESVKTEVQTGLVGSSGFVEILSPLEEGEVVSLGL